MHRQDTYDLREQILGDEHAQLHAHADAANHYGTDDEEHSVLEDDSEGEEQDDFLDDDDDASSSLSIPNESIDFDLVYAFHSFAATVDGQANVVKGDSLFLMDDSNSYWWLVRVLKTQEVGYIPAENIETPFERLARLNKHRNVDLASATQAELQDGLNASHDRLRNNLSSRGGATPSPNPTKSRKAKGVQFTPTLSVHRYLPAVWREDEMSDEEDVEWDDEGYEDEDPELASEQMQRRREEEEHGAMEADDPMQWASDAAEQHQQQQAAAAASRIPDALQPGSIREQQQTAALRAQQQQQLEQQQREQEMRQRQMMEQQQREQAQQRPIEEQPRQIDPLAEIETRKVTVTPSIARDVVVDDRPSGQPLLPSAILGKQTSDDSVKRRLEEEAEEAAKKKLKGKDKMGQPVSSSPLPGARPPGKLRKEPSRESDDDSKDKKKKSVFGGLFSRNKKEKKKDGSVSMGSIESSEYLARSSDDSGGRSLGGSSADGALSPVSLTALQQQQLSSSVPTRISESSSHSTPPSQSLPSTPDRGYGTSVRQRDQHQQALYQQYLNRSPSSPPEAQPSYGLQSVSALMPSSSSSALGPPPARQRPGSLILSPTTMDGGPGVPELSVVRVFAGKNLQTEATFKTVLLNASTSSGDLVRQAIQRFRLPAGEDANDYYLTIKQVEGGAQAVLEPEEHPLAVFEHLVVESYMDRDEMLPPKVKRSSVGSISSVVSNLSMHPAIEKLQMNDFTDDSAVKFYLNRKGEEGQDDSSTGHEGDETLIAESAVSHGGEFGDVVASPSTRTFPGGMNVTSDRFTSPSFRFPLQLVIYPVDLPDDMVFHPTTEAIVFKDTLRESNASTITSPTTVSSQLRRKVFIFPKNVTVAEVIELGLERFGILEGVVDGGDEIEDKYSKRRSSSRVRYGLVIDTGDGRERELSPSGRVIESFPRPPTLRTPERQGSVNKRRSIDAVNLLGSVEDVNPDDPIFILRRATSYRTSSTSSRNRSSAPLDEIALQQFQQQRESSLHSAADPSSPTSATMEQQKPATLRQLSSREIIAAQRAAPRANQRAILSAQSNSIGGVDMLLPGNAVLRSSGYDASDRMRYSYVEPDGETNDISDIVEEEWRDEESTHKDYLLEDFLSRNKRNLGDHLDRVLNKIKSGKKQQVRGQGQGQQDLARSGSMQSSSAVGRSTSPSEYSDDGESRRSVTLGSAVFISMMQQMQSGNAGGGRAAEAKGSGRVTPRGAESGLQTISESPGSVQQKRAIMPKDDFGIPHLMAITEYEASQPKKPSPPIHAADELLFGAPVDLDSLHPQARGIFAPGF
ncbi:hypothetical protein EST38_g10014 [Candolleomyces aberdarensis]|uniref:SH3 domain-containing protein n=1 Tax=Candolleomyces aberdarensis TaxID=2316362 RepID=A0A4Q2DBB4_9AGAR|nr:hypothetical protein EST38_g10014 [Candolleomyces aberdarensis]